MPPGPGPTKLAASAAWPAWWLRGADPATAYRLAGRWLRGCAALALGFGLAGLVAGLVLAPPDHAQGDAYRVIYIHVPAAWMSLALYAALVAAALLGLAPQWRVATLLAGALAPTGALMTFLTLWTGALWGKPTWGTWWVWDARLTSEAMLLVLFLGYLALQAATDDGRRPHRHGAVLALVGLVDLPVVWYSVHWWNTLHPGASVLARGEAGMAPPMLAALLLMVVAFAACSASAVLHRWRSALIEDAGAAEWARALPEARP